MNNDLVSLALQALRSEVTRIAENNAQLEVEMTSFFEQQKAAVEPPPPTPKAVEVAPQAPPKPALDSQSLVAIGIQKGVDALIDELVKTATLEAPQQAATDVGWDSQALLKIGHQGGIEAIVNHVTGGSQ